jgi:hypothetical protein
MTFGVIACTAIKVMIARLVGSAMAWKMSRLISFDFMRNRLAANISATIWFRKIFFKIFLKRKMWGSLKSRAVAVQLPGRGHLRLYPIGRDASCDPL